MTELSSILSSLIFSWSCVYLPGDTAQDLAYWSETSKRMFLGRVTESRVEKTCRIITPYWCEPISIKQYSKVAVLESFKGVKAGAVLEAETKLDDPTSYRVESGENYLFLSFSSAVEDCGSTIPARKAKTELAILRQNAKG